MGVILAIDEDASRYTRASRLAKDAGYELMRVSSPTAADRVFSEHHVVAVLLDFDMPGWTGDYYVQNVIPSRGVAVCVVSRNGPAANKLGRMLSARGILHTTITAARTDSADAWIAWVEQVDE